MDAFEYGMALISIVVGLAIGDLTISFQKLFRHRHTIIWDARPLATAALGFITLFTMWYQLWSVHDNVAILGYPFLLSLVVELVLLFLMTSMILPDEGEPNLDLGAYYLANTRAIWGLFLAFQLSFIAHWIGFVSMSEQATSWQVLAIFPIVCVPALVSIILMARPANRWLHLLAIGGLLVYSIGLSWQATLAPGGN